MKKWYENEICDNGIIISSRIRLARNLKKYPFYQKLSSEAAQKMIEEVKNSILNERTSLASQFNYVGVNTLTSNEKNSLMEKHIISPQLVEKAQNCGVIIKDDETINIMLNEEDHVRIQVIYEGDNMDKALDMAEKIDDLIEETIEYAFSENYGYLTSCPTNVGTGLRASYMMHLPYLEKTGQIKNVIQAISKFGVTIRGTYGEGTGVAGSIYQVSNQVTLGQTEEEIISNLKKVTATIIEQEKRMADKILSDARDELEDTVYRSYGILTSARKITSKEAMELISNLREGYNMGILKMPKPSISLFMLMMNIQPGTLQNEFATENDIDKRDKVRAKYIREQFI